MNDDKKEVYSRVALGLFISLGLVVFTLLLIFSEGLNAEPMIVAGVAILLAIGFVWGGLRALKDVKKGFPHKDERTEMIRMKASAKAFQVSFYWVLFLLWGVSVLKIFPIGIEEVFAVIILGMFALYGIYYYRFSKEGSV